MDILQTLPAELRQRMLALALPDECAWGKSLPRDVLNLVHISHDLRLDMGPILKMWSPMHYIAHAKDVIVAPGPTITINGHAYSPKFERLCLDLFHEAEADCIKNMAFQWPWCTHQDMVLQWLDAIPHLPKSLSEIYLDLTPAPPAMRSLHRLIINPHIHDKRTRSFSAAFARDVAKVARSIHTCYSGRISIYETGRLSEKSDKFFRLFREEFGADLEFVGTLITSEEARFAKITPPAKTKNLALHRLLHATNWSKPTRWSFALVANEHGENTAKRDLLNICELAADGQRNVLVMDPTNNARRALHHRVAADLSLETESEDVEERRRVIITKLPQEPEKTMEPKYTAKPMLSMTI
jgi:hypothetical protein